MISKYTYKKLTWIDVEKPTSEEVNRLKEEYKIPPLVAEEMFEKSIRSKVDSYENLLFMIMHFPVRVPSEGTVIQQEVDFVVSHNFVITVHYEPIEALKTFSKEFNVGSKLERGKDVPHAGYLFHFILKGIYMKTAQSLYDINAWLTKIEENIFNGKEEEMVFSISDVNRIIIDYSQTLRFHKENLQSFQVAAKDFFTPDFSYEMVRIMAEYNKVQHLLDGDREILADLRETNNSLLNTKTNKTVKKLTGLSFIMLPLTLIVGIFGMNMNMIFIKSNIHFFSIVGVMVAIAIGMYLYFKQKKWF